jgi:hypothetical protein
MPPRALRANPERFRYTTNGVASTRAAKHCFKALPRGSALKHVHKTCKTRAPQVLADVTQSFLGAVIIPRTTHPCKPAPRGQQNSSPSILPGLSSHPDVDTALTVPHRLCVLLF